MTAALLEFVYATMRKRINDPASSYWLPKILEKIQTPDKHSLSPLKVDKWELGALTGDQGVAIADGIAGAWWVFVGSAFDKAKAAGVPDLPDNLDDFAGQRDRDDQYPALTLTGVTVGGLPNASVGDLSGLTPTQNGYRGTVRIKAAAYDSHGYQPWIAIDGDYRLVQHAVVIDDPQALTGDGLKPPTKTVLKGLDKYGVHWPSQQIEGRGKFRFTVRDLAFDVRLSIDVAGSGAGRTAKVTVESVAIATKPTFTLDEKALTIEGDTVTEKTKDVWKKSAKNAFNSDESAKALTAKLAAALNADDFRTEFSGSVTDQLSKALDGVLGTGPLPADSGQPPTGDGPLDVYLFDRVRAALNDKGSGFYPPTVVRGSTDPKLDPLKIDNIELGVHKVIVVDVDFHLEDVVVGGIPNVLIPAEDAALVAGGIDATLRFGRISGEPQITVHATGVGKIVKSGDHFHGPVVVTVNQPSVALGLSFSGRDADELTIGLRSLDLQVTEDKLSIEVHIGKWDLSSLFNSSDIKNRVIKGIQDGANDRKNDIAKALTDNARKVIAAKLKG
ncbi:hypothetical protein [Streptomyces yunnanensis]|uniref:Uncharacterized protein n=1 Tax=Streptomyces yunnanensis TaxID=156453 RepID=A0A9X8QST4_9ACTN|nr:hypothetical protein [Streptomyces yunnanensis]SHL84210.1 hypothetical protein SAMN05216268_106386 [Streptomyces yunnanensis]